MSKLLHSIADIRTGHAFRGRIEEDPDGDYPVLQIKDLKGRTRITSDQLPRIKWQSDREPVPAVVDDILLPTRGEHYNAVILQGGEPVVVTGQLYVLKTKTTQMTAEFLAWYLNQKTAQHYFLSHRTGSSIHMLNKQSLQQLKIPTPPLEIQQKIVTLHDLWVREREVTEQLLDNRETMLNGIFHNLLEQ
ncbi:MAG: restriction endonuclease subunit S [Candidatus Thiodiazotropha lotti]|nr:restriction endonuclease subunit S [Candidatus Thiodiazotropha lotti]MCG8001901.1 restriction endonuclease subunit S [Candidatus Thiodiazotropha lotti]MCW4185519.1 restriction endonuclease subunit S [Candidatus Thiodiazotropha lotti]MCW4197733.1 restriction endonuclease subunit S [Candidatus Thiodiazotropha lotti]